MRLRLVALLIAAALFSGCAVLTGGPGGQEGRELWPVSVLPWQEVPARIGSAEVVLVCLVDQYDEKDLAAPQNDPGPSWFGPPKGRNMTPAQVLASWLRGARTLADREIMTAAGEPDPAKMMIYVVEGHDKTREWAGELFERNGMHYYDGTIPVIYVFHNRQLTASYTYVRNPGAKGGTLRNMLHDLFTRSFTEGR